jgi:hypothetical protein
MTLVTFGTSLSKQAAVLSSKTIFRVQSPARGDEAQLDMNRGESGISGKHRKTAHGRIGLLMSQQCRWCNSLGVPHIVDS